MNETKNFCLGTFILAAIDIGADENASVLTLILAMISWIVYCILDDRISEKKG